MFDHNTNVIQCSMKNYFRRIGFLHQTLVYIKFPKCVWFLFDPKETQKIIHVLKKCHCSTSSVNFLSQSYKKFITPLVLIMSMIDFSKIIFYHSGDFPNAKLLAPYCTLHVTIASDGRNIMAHSYLVVSCSICNLSSLPLHVWRVYWSKSALNIINILLY